LNNFTEILKSINSFLPELSVITTLLLCLIADIIIRKKSPIVTIIAIAGLLVSAYFVYMQSAVQESLFSGMLVIDPFAVFFKYLFILSSIIILIFFEFSNEIKESTHKNEYSYLILSLVLGAFLMASSVNLLMMYLSLELASLTSYILAGYSKSEKKSSESSMKYLIYGAASSGIMLYGMSLLYGFTGSLDIYEISRYLATNPTPNAFIYLTMIMIAAGLGYKTSSVPFHFWTPDVYEGSPTPVTAFLAVTSSAAGFSLITRLFLTTFLGSTQIVDGAFSIIAGIHWQEIIIVISVASMIVGNFVAIWQKSLKRLLGYSSIAQGGYMLAGLVVADTIGLTAMLIYLSAYLFMNLGAFFVTILIVNKLGTDDIEQMKGLGYRLPFVGVAMAVFMLALSGIPATVGFIGKFYLVTALMKPGAGYLWFAIVLMLNSVVSLFFYLKVVKSMFLERADNTDELPGIKFSVQSYIILILLLIPTIFFGLYFGPIVKLAESSAVLFGIR
jgi:NADH-quinone oxidoreductase subunit N